MEKPKKEISEVEKSKTKDLFILAFPTFVITGIAAGTSNVYLSLISIGLAVYQFAILHRFIDTYRRSM